GMAGGVTADDETVPKDLAARRLADGSVDALVRAAGGRPRRQYDVGVLGYHAVGGAVRMVSLLPGGEVARFVSTVELARLPAENRPAGEPRWVRGLLCEGPAPAAAALAEVHRLLTAWLAGRYAGPAPVVVVCTDGEGLGPAYLRVAQSLAVLET